MPGFASFLEDGSLAEGAKAHIGLNIGSLLCCVETGELPKKDLPYMIAESLMHETIHALESWAKVEFSEEKVEELLQKYRAKYRPDDEKHWHYDPEANRDNSNQFAAAESKLVQEAVMKWIDGPEGIEEFCGWLIERARAGELTDTGEVQNDANERIETAVVSVGNGGRAGIAEATTLGKMVGAGQVKGEVQNDSDNRRSGLDGNVHSGISSGADLRNGNTVPTQPGAGQVSTAASEFWPEWAEQKFGKYEARKNPPDWAILFAEAYATSRVGELEKQLARLRDELDHESAAHLETIDDRDSMEDALQKAHIALGGDGEWVSKFPAAHELPGCTGDLRIDVPHIAGQIFEEAQESGERAEKAEQALRKIEALDDHRHDISLIRPDCASCIAKVALDLGKDGL